jgi:hypothetical protein
VVGVADVGGVVVGAPVAVDADALIVDADAGDVAGTAVVVAAAGAALVADVAVEDVSSSPLHATSASSDTTARARHDIAVTVGVSVQPVPVTSTCESCGATEDELYAVHRQYVTPAEWDTPGREVTLAEVERWCYSCLTHYPHVLVGADDTSRS